MGANDKNLEIIKKVFGGDAGKQGAYFRELFEVLILEREGIELNEVQEAEIEKRINEAKIINRHVCSLNGVIPLEDLKPDEILKEE